MLSLVWERRPTYNNTEAIASSRITTYYKMLYYLGYAVAYGTVGSLATLVMVNSSWTYGHIRSLWRGVRKVHIVFPPCDTESFETLPLNSRERERIVLSIAQFRPEKDHVLQLRSFALYLSKYQPQENVTLVLIGSCRGKDDEGRVQDLRNLAKTLGVDNKVEFVLNQPFPELRPWLGRASVGLHTMWNEHFGIGVVEMMSAGLITIAHNSGGPKADIIVPHKTGFLAGSAEEYALAIDQAMQISSTDEGLTMRRAARDSAKRFSDKVFVDSFHHAFLSANLF